ncbi:hypothetical protein D3C87_2195750 [compost metagenome]
MVECFLVYARIVNCTPGSYGCDVTVYNIIIYITSFQDFRDLSKFIDNFGNVFFKRHPVVVEFSV